MDRKELDIILEKHHKWVNGEADGKRADLRGADLRGADLRGAYLRRADLEGADLRGADLEGANLRGAYLRRAYLRRAYLRRADLEGADLEGADLRRADLEGADLRGAYLRRADLRGAENIPLIPLVCPEKGTFTAFKKAYIDNVGVVVELEIPEDAKRLSGTSRKCRASKALVKAIYEKQGNEWVISNETKANGWHSSDFIYTVGKTVIPDGFDEDRWKECSNGIHFFMSFEEAMRW